MHRHLLFCPRFFPNFPPIFSSPPLSWFLAAIPASGDCLRSRHHHLSITVTSGSRPQPSSITAHACSAAGEMVFSCRPLEFCCTILLLEALFRPQIGTDMFADGHGVEHHRSPPPLPQQSPPASRLSFPIVTPKRATVGVAVDPNSFLAQPAVDRHWCSCQSSPESSPSFIARRQPFSVISGQIPISRHQVSTVHCRITIVAELSDPHHHPCHRHWRDRPSAIPHDLLPILYKVEP